MISTGLAGMTKEYSPSALPSSVESSSKVGLRMTSSMRLSSGAVSVTVKVTVSPAAASAGSPLTVYISDVGGAWTEYAFGAVDCVVESSHATSVAASTATRMHIVNAIKSLFAAREM